jgi:glycosyltransferase involved in cell wall biosynthesis
MGIVRAFIKGLPMQCGYFYSARAKRKIQKLIRTVYPDHIYCFMIRMAEYVKKYKDCHKTLDYQDALSVGMKRRAEKAPFWKKSIFLYEYQALKRYEKNVFSCFTNKTIITHTDRDLISHSQRQYIQVIPNGIDFEMFKYMRIKKEYDMIFTGNMSYPPNVDAALFLAKDIFPVLLQKFPKLKLCICGTSPSPAIKALESDNITVTGWVDDISEYYAKSKIFVAPMKLGTGLQNKLLEAMAMKLPCVTSTLAGKPLEDALQDKQESDELRVTPHSSLVTRLKLIICQNIEDFVEAVSKLITDKTFYKNVAENGYKFVKENYDWETVGKMLEEVMNED